ncbi:MAG: hypothetical protein ACLT98_05645 [Eggerthellaceae bacterium]
MMYGRTWHMLRWMRRVTSLYEANDPEDQFGRLLMLCAQVARNRPDALCELLGDAYSVLVRALLACSTAAKRRRITDLPCCAATLRDVQGLCWEPAVRRMYR